MKRVALVAVLLLSSGVAHSTPKLATARTSLLGDHLTFTLAEGMRVEPRPHSIMAADASNDDETRALLDVGKMRFVMMAVELYATRPADFRAAVTATLHAQGEPLARAKLEEVPLGIAAVPSVPGNRGANLIYSAYLANTDRSVQVISFYINPEGMPELASFLALARQIVASAAPGGRKLELVARDLSFRGVSSDKLVISVPAGIVASTQEGPDFSVNNLREVGELGAQTGTCGIYLGGHPGYLHKQASVDDAKVVNVAGKLLGAAVTWHAWTDGQTFTVEAMVPHPLQASLLVHAFCRGSSPAAVDKLRKMAETARVQR